MKHVRDIMGTVGMAFEQRNRKGKGGRSGARLDSGAEETRVPLGMRVQHEIKQERRDLSRAR
jgi:hypothetical protein